MNSCKNDGESWIDLWARPFRLIFNSPIIFHLFAWNLMYFKVEKSCISKILVGLRPPSPPFSPFLAPDFAGEPPRRELQEPPSLGCRLAEKDCRTRSLLSPPYGLCSHRSLWPKKYLETLQNLTAAYKMWTRINYFQLFLLFSVFFYFLNILVDIDPCVDDFL